MAQVKHVVDPFGEVNVYPAGGKMRVTATILMEPRRTGTQMLPAVLYFVDRFQDAPWGFYIFITDGELHDLDAVKQYSTDLARAVSAGRRKPLKFVLIGVGDNINEQQMEELDDLDSG